MIEWLLYGLIACGALLIAFIPSLLGICRHRTVFCCLVVIGGIPILGYLQFELWDLRTSTASEAIPPPRQDNLYVGSSACRTCHPKEYETWHKTYHRTMTQQATTEAVLAPFDGRELIAYDMTTRVETRGDEFWVDMVDPEWIQSPDRIRSINPPRVQKQIVMTTGSHHLQFYWHRGPDRELWMFPWGYHIAEQRWMHRDVSFLHPAPTEPGRMHQVWNETCIECHSVAGQPGKDAETGLFSDTRIAELGIACESCHGPAGQHVRANQNPVRRYKLRLTEGSDPTIIHPTQQDSNIEMQICGSCHSQFDYVDEKAVAQRYTKGREFRPGQDMKDVARFLTLSDDSTRRHGTKEITVTRYWADGASRGGGREYNGLIDSPCHSQGELTCAGCHSMHQYHSDPVHQLAKGMRSNAACNVCHEEIRDNLTAHTHHAADSEGSLCYNCHMPYTSYALLRAIRSHRIDIPEVVPIESNTRPNACNLCHLDRTLAWTNSRLEQWYGTSPTELPQEEQRIAASLLWLLRGDAGQRAITAWHMGWKPAMKASGQDWLTPFLAQLTSDPYAAVRFIAFDSMRKSKPFSNLENLFDASPKDRATARLEIVRRWTTLPVPDWGNRSTEVLFNHSKVDWDAVAVLLKKRDNRLIVSAE